MESLKYGSHHLSTITANTSSKLLNYFQILLDLIIFITFNPVNIFNIFITFNRDHSLIHSRRLHHEYSISESSLAGCSKAAVPAPCGPNLLGHCSNNYHSCIRREQAHIDIQPYIQTPYFVNTPEPDHRLFPTTKDSKCQRGANGMGASSVRSLQSPSISAKI